MTVSTTSNEVQVGAQGRLVIPAALRKSLSLKPGERLVMRQVGQSLVLERRAAIEQRLQNRFRRVDKQVNLVDELLADRRAAAAKEAEGS